MRSGIELTERYKMSDGDFNQVWLPGDDDNVCHDPYPDGLECWACGEPIHEHDDGICPRDRMDEALAGYDADGDLR